MKADNLSFLEFIGPGKRTFCIPVYQRNYDWKRMQCITLFKDIETIAVDKNRDSHFLGTIVYVEGDSTPNFRQFIVQVLLHYCSVLTNTGYFAVFAFKQRIIKLSQYLAQKTNAPLDTVQRTALLCKADLVTSLVFEFTELQGFIGSDYAFNAGEKKEVVQGIKEHYYPLGADSELASGIEGQLVGIADKIDTIVAVFAEGKKPTGSADPLGVRRATLGIIKTVIQKSLNIDLLELINKSIDLMPVEIADKSALFNEVKTFFEQRLSIYYTEKYRHDIVDACISGGNSLSGLKGFADRVEFISEQIKTQEFAKLNEAANRIIRIVKDYKSLQLPEPALFNCPSEKQLWECTSVIDIDKLNYKEIFIELLKTVNVIDDFFEKVLVMDKDEKVKQNRLNLLYSVKQKFDKIADFSKFVI